MTAHKTMYVHVHGIRWAMESLLTGHMFEACIYIYIFYIYFAIYFLYSNTVIQEINAWLNKCKSANFKGFRLVYEWHEPVLLHRYKRERNPAQSTGRAS